MCFAIEVFFELCIAARGKSTIGRAHRYYYTFAAGCEGPAVKCKRYSLPGPSYEAPCIILCRIRSRRLSARKNLLATAVFVLGKTVPAIHWTVFSGFERNFTLLFAVRTDSFMHLSRTPVVSSILKSHVISPLMVLRITDWGYASRTIA